jgi:hypothetical protein
MLFLSVDLCVPRSFVRCLCPTDCPPEQAKPLFLEYAALEEQHGLARHAMQVRDDSEQMFRSRSKIFTPSCVCAYASWRAFVAAVQCASSPCLTGQCVQHRHVPCVLG